MMLDRLSVRGQRIAMTPPKRPTDVNQRAKLITQIATGEVVEKPKNAAAVALGKLGGAKGGKARAAKLTPDQRKKAAQKAAKARWSKDT